VQKTQPDCFKLLANKDLLAVHQDPAANPPRFLFAKEVNSTETRDGRNMTKTAVVGQGFSRTLADGSVALVLLNRLDRGSETLSASWAEMGLPAGAKSCAVRDLLAQAPLPDATAGSFSSRLNSHQASFVRITCAKENVESGRGAGGVAE
jgi:hypothetical protein